MDSHLPVMDGAAAAEAIRSAEKDAHVRVPILALTGNVTESARTRCLAAGMDAVLRKPVKPRDLLAAVAEWSATRAGTPVAQWRPCSRAIRPTSRTWGTSWAPTLR